MGLLEAQVHDLLKQWLREQAPSPWPHHFTLGRLVSRALRLRRSALIQTGCLPRRYSCSYLLPCLLSPDPIHLIVSAERQHELESRELPALQAWLTQQGDDVLVHKPPILISPEEWLSQSTNAAFDADRLTLIEQSDYLEEWSRDHFSVTLTSQELAPGIASLGETTKNILQNAQARLTKYLFSRPQNPHQCYLLTEDEQELLAVLLQALKAQIPRAECFWQCWQTLSRNYLLWADLNRPSGHFSFTLSPVEISPFLGPYWRSLQDEDETLRSPLILMGSFLDVERQAPTFRQNLGLPDLLCLKFTPQRQTESIQVYLPERLPLPNTPEFSPVLFEQIQQLLTLCAPVGVPTVILLDDLPLKAQLATQLAAEFGSRVKVESLPLQDASIVISSWAFWGLARTAIQPRLLILATLPIPSPEHPLVASRIRYHKRHHQDWFRGYLLPSALQTLQRAVLPLREVQGTIAIFDPRVNSRTYGRQILGALEPYAKCNYLDLLNFP